MRLPLAIIAVVLAGSFALHAHHAANPSAYQSADERSYGKLAINLAEQGHYGDRSTQMEDPLHWPPGAPMLFAVAHRLAPSATDVAERDIGAAYWAQAIVSTGTALAAFAFAWALAGIWAGVAAGALVGFYPPLILQTGEQLSEPLGAFLVTAAFAVLAWSARRRLLAGYAVAGAVLGLAVLTRADLLLAPFLVALLCGLWLWRARLDLRRGVAVGGLIAGGAAATMVPWIAYASDRAGTFVPVTRGSAAPLFVGTYLPGDGHTVGMKRALEAEVKRFKADLRDIPAFEIPAAEYMDMIAARHPSLPEDAAVRREARRNLWRYLRSDPLAMGVMALDKVQRMWTRYARGGARHTSPWIRAWHIVLVLGAFAGVIGAVWRRRDVLLGAVLLVVAYSTALHVLVVSQARYNLPLLPSLLAAGVAGWFLLRRGHVGRERPTRPVVVPPPGEERPAEVAKA